jgi:hypothetical protein
MALDAWHLLASFWDLDAIADQDKTAIETHRFREQPQHCPGTGGGRARLPLARRELFFGKPRLMQQREVFGCEQWLTLASIMMVVDGRIQRWRTWSSSSPAD